MTLSDPAPVASPLEGHRGSVPEVDEDVPAVGRGSKECGRQRAPYASASQGSANGAQEYPLIDLGISRDGCHSIIRDAGLPVPPRSACYFCPHHKDEEWKKLARDEPELFEKSCELEEEIHRRGKVLQAKRIAEGKKPGSDLYFTRHGVLLRDLFHGGDTPLFTDLPEDGPGCEAGYCHT